MVGGLMLLVLAYVARISLYALIAACVATTAVAWWLVQLLAPRTSQIITR
ncbi:hypothetical protein [Bailinhaonella thermotolerans]|nr:hypothetical protein [Bailinhaonella thermotolerans]